MQSHQQLVGVRPVHSGPLFNVFRATLAGADIAIKRPADTVRWNEALATAWTHSNPTNVFHHVQLGWAEPEPLPGVSYVEALLRAEQTVLESAATHWNHPGAKLARWRHDDTLGPADDVEAGPLCMLMPWCSGVALGSLPREEQRRWFPAMLPALWQALAVCPHGDLSPADLMLERTQGFFRIFDPGVRISGPSYPAAQRGGSQDAEQAGSRTWRLAHRQPQAMSDRGTA